MAASIGLICNTERTAQVETAMEILKRTVAERTGISMLGEEGSFTIRLDIHAGIGTEGFRLERSADSVAITGNDSRGLIYGIGKFLRASRFAGGSFIPGEWQGKSVPIKPVRAMYFASHFHNFYHDAPIAEVERYVEELALWGCNSLSVWFDMHHFSGIDDPRAQTMIKRLHAILEAANRVGMGAALTTLANEAFAASPKELRADWTAGHDGYRTAPGGHYHVEICPSKPGGLAKIIEYRREAFEAFKDLQMEYVWIWPYDQGGCTCSECAPWGANGFLRAAEAEARLIHEYWPTAKTVLSTWYFDHFIDGEWEGLHRIFSEKKPEWVDYIMADDYGGFPEYPLKHGIPGGFPALGFPEISMEFMWPWGGFGANPRPKHWQKHWDESKDLLDGSFPYSEGIFEDLNKVTILQLEWDPGRAVDDIISEYAAYEYSPAIAGEIVQAVNALEDNMNHRLSQGILEKLWARAEHVGDQEDDVALGSMEYTGPLYLLPAAEAAEACRDSLRRAEMKLDDYAKNSWRWRILRLRAELDAELLASNGAATKKSEEHFGELTSIYHAENAEAAVAPPSVAGLERLARA